MKLTFLGATGTVTGSKYMIEDGESRILIDCGLFQGLKELRLRNWESLPVSPASIDSVILTHAHIDHSGYLPILIRDGFKGKVYCSAATMDLCGILLPDSGYIHEKDAERANKYSYSKHHPALPLYTRDDAYNALEYFKAVDINKEYKISEFLNFSLSRAGHILGACSVQINDGQTSVLFSGDIGRFHDPVIKSPASVNGADYVVLESTYGDRLHEDSDPAEIMGEVIRRTTARGGVVLIPAFAVGRVQSILYYLHKLKKEKSIPSVPIYLDSPMAINATDLLKSYEDEHRLKEEEYKQICDVATYTQSMEDSKSINSNDMPKIIISASGMATGGRVVHHMKNLIGDRKNTILFAGYQAAGTRGERLTRGEKEIKIHGHVYDVNAEIVLMDNMSAHADYAELLNWIGHFSKTPRKVFLTHGEPEAAQSLKKKIEDRFGWKTEIPQYLDIEEL